MEKINELTDRLHIVLEKAIELEANPKILEEDKLEVMPRCEYDVDMLRILGKQQNVEILVNDIYLQELEDSKKALDEFCSILNLAEVSHDVIGINKKVLKYRLVIFPTSKDMEMMLRKDAEKVDKVEFIFESGAIQAMDEQGELEDHSERGERLRQKEEVCKKLASWGIEYQLSDLETVEIFPTSYQEKQNIQRQLGKYSLLNLVFKTEKYTKIPMTGSEKREIIKDLANKFKKYGNGFIEMKNPFTIIAYAKNEKIADTYRKIFSDYWYKYVEVDGKIETLKLIVEPLYSNGEMFLKEEWLSVVNKAREGAEGLKNVVVEVPNEGQLIVKAPNFTAVKSLYWIKNYHDRKLESDHDRGYVYTNIIFKLEE
ncbi:hypothetical protein [Enterococcus wangshanyuanii]|uniref:Uncharacterized protein n=1 Tax=Enterococcus wangshanyuanii TaxID=2005703 RepID=A0ABQ1PCY1_9ENTE|nr:hypothetical protein [Enterococcus wangshanyuanii]GGC94791.1 hypothetical protein GCM10011573_25540 [Enterococcus wangshanyuanii]